MPEFVPHIVFDGFDDFEAAYWEAALWTCEPDTADQAVIEQWLDAEMSPEAAEHVRNDCAAFRRSLGVTLAIGIGQSRGNDVYSSEAMAGHDFWLTRNHHGCGFWDGDWPIEIEDSLTKRAQRFREVELIVGDDGLLYFE